MKVKVKVLRRGAELPMKAHESDFCYDVVATSCEEVAPGVFRYGTGLSFEIERGGFDGSVVYGIDLRPRSSVWKTGMVLSNCCGTIDEGYRGEVMAVFYHVLRHLPRYKVGDRIGQIKLGATEPMEFVVVDALSATERGAGGYGSTGE